jgi:hypothetical protein
MPDRQQHPEDLPWNDAPADSEAPPGSEEPEPAEVTGDDGEESDLAGGPRVPDPYDKYRQETLAQRLAEEESDRGTGAPPDERAGGLVDPDQGGGDVYTADKADEDDFDEPGAEESAIHLRDEGDV